MAQRKGGLRAALKERKVRRSNYDLPVVEFEVAQKAANDVTLARSTLQATNFLIARGTGDLGELTAARSAAESELEKAEEALSACFHRIWLQAIPEQEFDALVNAHPATAEQVETARERGEEIPVWNEETFPYELLEHCVQDSELSAAEWETELAGWERPEKRELIQRCIAVNIRSFNASLDFG